MAGIDNIADIQIAISIAAAAIGLLVASVQFQQRARTIEGTWIDLFETTRFFKAKMITLERTPKNRGMEDSLVPITFDRDES